MVVGRHSFPSWPQLDVLEVFQISLDMFGTDPDLRLG